MSLFSLELCAGGGGQALGLEGAGFQHVGVVEYEPQYCTTLRLNRPHWNVIQQDIRDFQPDAFGDVDLITGGVPHPRLASSANNSVALMNGTCSRRL